MKKWIPDLQETENVKTVKRHITRREQKICKLFAILVEAKPEQVSFRKCIRNDIAFLILKILLRGETVRHFSYRVCKYGCLTAEDYENLNEDERLAWVNYPDV